MSKILLTGAAGRIGGHLRTWFAERGRAVLATDIRQPEQGDGLEGPRLLAEHDGVAGLHVAQLVGEDRAPHHRVAQRAGAAR